MIYLVEGLKGLVIFVSLTIVYIAIVAYFGG